MKRILAGAFALGMTFLLGGCLGVHLGVGGGTHTSVRNQSSTANYDTTLGQQLEDLQKAYEQGIITKSEYDHERKRLLKYYLPR